MNPFLAWLLLVTASFAAATSSLYPVQENGPRSQRINIVFLSEGYTVAQLPDFADDVDDAISYLFSREPWRQYRSYCNVFRIEIASNQSGCDNGSAGATRDTYFNTGFNTPGVTQLITFSGAGSSSAFDLLNTHVPEYDIPVVLVNDSKYGGSGGPITVASANSLSVQIVEHEIGHSFAGLADEYDTYYPGYTPSEKPNNTAEVSRSRIKWRDWIAADEPLPTPETTSHDEAVGLFEGSMYRTEGWYRPHNDSVMRNLGRPVGQVNRQQFVLSYYSRIDPAESWSPTSTRITANGRKDLVFSVKPKVPSDGAVTTRWFVNGIARPGTSDSLTLNSDLLGNGNHNVTARVADTTAFVRTDPTRLLEQEITWELSLTNQAPGDLAAWRATYGPDDSNPAADGYDNLMKYSLGLNPLQAVTPGERSFASITPINGSDYLTLTVPRRLRRFDITYTAQISDDLLNWKSGPGHTVVIQDTDTLLVVRDALPLAASPRRAMRLSVSEY